ncbi:LCP family protein [Deinococcus peraridilitoris]|uniref:Cell envelope-related function transcriptional attenuator common domain protein n=1 Tax=Deinococcus peraridilitoris (strain DSM 19664 / LMG 22246 / CIP 109416 / KR-200) TaxID=937777 RepID=L0A1R6_DEIPD|nr:LCP family protein [Deinococcus peraridilitoris]AFZ66960.1 cell envelope-related function transcriptional attenuator common domain protein [Deinococcus peraridilitoris DSM 19664]
MSHKPKQSAAPKPTEFYSEAGRTVPVWRAWQLASIALATLSLAGYWTLTSTAGEVRRAALVTPEGQPPRFTVLLAGRDIAYCYYRTPCQDQNSERAQRESRTDTLMLMKVDGTRVNILTVPRDTQAGSFDSFLDAGSQKINAAYAFGGPEQLVSRIEEITGERIDYYAVVRTDFVAAVISALGGLVVNVPAKIDFDDYAAGLHVHLESGPQRLNGKEAVAFLRMRKGVGDDYGRMDHQKAAIAQLVDKLRTPGGLAGALPAILRGFSGSVQTNADPALIQQMVPYLRDYKLSFATLPTREIPGTTNLMPDREALAELWGGASTTLASEQSVPVRIVDASGTGLGPKVAWALKARGFRVTEVSDSAISGERSQVFTLSEVGSAESVSRWLDLPRLQGLRFPVERGEVGVYLGTDARARYAELARLPLSLRP